MAEALEIVEWTLQEQVDFWRGRAEAAEAKLADALARLAVLEEQQVKLSAQVEKHTKHRFGKRSEKQKPGRADAEATEGEEAKPKRKPRAPLDPDKAAAAKEQREDNQQRWAEVEREIVVQAIPEELRHCPCGEERKQVGVETSAPVREWVPGHFVNRVYQCPTLKCPCCEDLVKVPAPAKVLERCAYGATFLAKVLIEKVADALPLHRQQKRYRRQGLPIARSTLCDLFHKSAGGVLQLIAQRLQALIQKRELVFADETPLRVIKSLDHINYRGYMWVFLADLGTQEPLVVFVFSPSRSGETPRQVLGSSEGYLLVDAYTGYNTVCDPDKRKRAGCWGHGRRGFVEALNSGGKVAEHVLELIRELYKVEDVACERRITGTSAHLELRQQLSKPIVEELKAYVAEQRTLELRDSPLGGALRYLENQWERLTLFLEDARLPLDNNASERALRIVAVGRKNYGSVGSEVAGADLATVLTLNATCEALGINPEEYIADVLSRWARERVSVEELLPHVWKARREAERRAEAEAARAVEQSPEERIEPG